MATPAAPSTATPADALIRSADKAAENTTKSALDSTFSSFQLPANPSDLGKQYGQAASDLLGALDIPSALDQSNRLTQDAAVSDAASMFENKAKREALAATPVGDLDKEIDRLSQERWGILPAILGRSDIIDYGAKLRIASHAEQIMDDQITKLSNTRKSFADAAEAKAKDHIDELKASAALLDKQATAAQNDLNSRIQLFQAGRGTFNDIVQASLAYQKILDDRKKASDGGNGLVGLGTGAGNFSSAELASFAYFEKFGDFPVADSSKLQVKQALTQRYAAWVQAGKPGGTITTTSQKALPPGVSGPLPAPTTSTMNISDIFATPAAARQSGIAALLLGGGTGGAGSASSSGGGNLPDPNGEFGDAYTPSN